MKVGCDNALPLGSKRILQHSNHTVSKESYIRAFDPAVLDAMKSMEASLDMLNDCAATVQQVN